MSGLQRFVRTGRYRSSGPKLITSSSGSTWAAPRASSEFRRRRSDRPPRPARSRVLIHCPTVPGFSADQNSTRRPRDRSLIALARTLNTRRDRIPINKTSFLQWHRKMGVMKHGCTNASTAFISGGQLRKGPIAVFDQSKRAMRLPNSPPFRQNVSGWSSVGALFIVARYAKPDRVGKFLSDWIAGRLKKSAGFILIRGLRSSARGSGDIHR